jgi:hypothetical protein
VLENLKPNKEFCLSRSINQHGTYFSCLTQCRPGEWHWGIWRLEPICQKQRTAEKSTSLVRCKLEHVPSFWIPLTKVTSSISVATQSRAFSAERHINGIPCSQTRPFIRRSSHCRTCWHSWDSTKSNDNYCGHWLILGPVWHLLNHSWCSCTQPPNKQIHNEWMSSASPLQILSWMNFLASEVR